MKLKLSLIVLVLVLIGAGFVGVKYYSFVFAKTIRGELTGVERVNENQAIIATGSAVPSSQMFSFAIALRDEKGEIHTASSEDRQWAVAKAGQCAEVRIFPYPFWDLQKANTYFGARLERLYDCPAK